MSYIVWIKGTVYIALGDIYDNYDDFIHERERDHTDSVIILNYTVYRTNYITTQLILL